jgi:hypothetical protein
LDRDAFLASAAQEVHCPETGLEDIKGNLPEADFRPASLKFVSRHNFRVARHSPPIPKADQDRSGVCTNPEQQNCGYNCCLFRDKEGNQ